MIRNRYIRPELWQRTARWLDFYAQFISNGDLVFDIGANHGDRTEIFVEMGARVVAIEPIQSLAARLKDIFRYSQVNVEAVGVGSAFGTLPLHVCTTAEMSSFSDQFIESQRVRGTEFKWDEVRMVPLVTLDSLIHKYGAPQFVKIDVEGFESEVLAGLTQPLKSLSFEIRPADLAERIGSCIQRLTSLGEYEFNVSVEESLSWELPRWANGSAVLNLVSNLPRSGWHYADIYARRTAN